MIPAILKRFTWLFLKQNDLAGAREYNDRRTALQKSLNLPYEDDGFLLVAEGQYDRAIREAMPYVSVAGDEKFDKRNEIEHLIILACAWRGKGDSGKAREMLDRAEGLMRQTGCWLERDRLEDWKDYVYRRNLMVITKKLQGRWIRKGKKSSVSLSYPSSL